MSVKRPRWPSPRHAHRAFAVCPAPYVLPLSLRRARTGPVMRRARLSAALSPLLDAAISISPMPNACQVEASLAARVRACVNLLALADMHQDVGTSRPFLAVFAASPRSPAQYRPSLIGVYTTRYRAPSDAHPHLPSPISWCDIAQRSYGVCSRGANARALSRAADAARRQPCNARCIVADAIQNRVLPT